LFVVWGLFMAGTLLVVGVLKLTPNAGASKYSAPVCGPSRAGTYTRPVVEMKPARPEPITVTVRPDPVTVVDKNRQRCEGANEELRKRGVAQPEPEPAYLVENWPVRKPTEPIERN
jgi:hypothetical protein